MHRFISFLILAPIVVVLIALALVNRQIVPLTLDVLGGGNPALTVHLPLYLVVLGSIVFGLVIGGLYTWARQGRWRRAAREHKYQARIWEDKARVESDRAQEIARNIPGTSAG